MTQPEVDHPSHYNNSPSGVECIDVVEHMNFNRGNAIKYIWRAGDKGEAITDLQKARWYLDREIERLGRQQAPVKPGRPCSETKRLGNGQLIHCVVRDEPGISHHFHEAHHAGEEITWT